MFSNFVRADLDLTSHFQNCWTWKSSRMACSFRLYSASTAAVWSLSQSARVRISTHVLEWSQLYLTVHDWSCRSHNRLRKLSNTAWVRQKCLLIPDHNFCAYLRDQHRNWLSTGGLSNTIERSSEGSTDHKNQIKSDLSNIMICHLRMQNNTNKNNFNRIIFLFLNVKSEKKYDYD